MHRTKRERQAAKIHEIREALVGEGFVTLGEQSAVLQLGKSTTWVMLKAFQKGSGLSAKVINRILAAPNLPETVRSKLVEYVEEKIAGLYDHNDVQSRKFPSRLTGFWQNRFGKRADDPPSGIG